MDDERFDLDFHLRRASVPSPGGRFQLERAVGRVLSRPLDRTKPLWELYVFEDLAEDRTAVLLKLHHAMADGIGGMMIASALFDLAPDAPLGAPEEAWLPEPAPPPQDLFRDAVEELVLHPLQGLTHLARQPRIFARTRRPPPPTRFGPWRGWGRHPEVRSTAGSVPTGGSRRPSGRSRCSG